MMILVFILLLAATALSAYLHYNQSSSTNQFGCATVDSSSTFSDHHLPDGKLLFNANCASCHSMNKTLTGPALLRLMDRWPDKKMLTEHIMNAEQFRKKSNYTKKLWLEYGKIECPKFSDVLTPNDTKSILEYLQLRQVEY